MNKSMWRDFELEVHQLLTIIGVEAHHNILLQGRQTDIFCRAKDGFTSARILIECKSTTSKGNSIPVSYVTEFCSRLSLARAAGLADFGWLISNCKFTANAHCVLHEAGLEGACQLLTLEDLYSKFLDHRPYLTQLVNSLPPSSTGYVEPTLTEVYSHRIDFKGSQSFRVLFNQWLNHSSYNLMLLLGDFGQGKSTCCHQIVRDYISNTCDFGGRLPLYIRLRDVANQGYTLPAILRVCLHENFGLNYNSYELLRLLSSKGKLLFIFDGLDEISFSLRWSDVHSSMREIGKLAEGSSKVLITARPAIFPTKQATHSAMESLLPPKESKRYVLGRLRYFSEAEIRTAIRNFGLLDVDSTLSSIVSKHGLWDLAKRPITLKMILESIHDGLLDRGDVSSLDVYGIYTGEWLRRDAWRSNVSSLSIEKNRDFKFEFVTTLAWNMFTASTHQVDSREIEKHVRLFFKEDADFENIIQSFTKEISVCSFLDLQQNGSLAFSHKSFFEYFLSVYICNQLSANRLQPLCEHVITEGVAYFVSMSDEWKGLRRRQVVDDVLRSSRNLFFNYLLLNRLSKGSLIEKGKLPNDCRLSINSSDFVSLEVEDSKIDLFCIKSNESVNVRLENCHTQEFNISSSKTAHLFLHNSTIEKIMVDCGGRAEFLFENTMVKGGIIDVGKKSSMNVKENVSVVAVELQSPNNFSLMVDSVEVVGSAAQDKFRSLGFSIPSRSIKGSDRGRGGSRKKAKYEDDTIEDDRDEG